MPFDINALPSVNEVWGWHKELALMGPRYTGSLAHAQFTDWLKAKFSALTDFQLHTDTIIFQRWLAEDWSLSIEQDPNIGPSGDVPVSYFYPYSGYTDPNGITARLIDLGEFTPGFYVPGFWTRASGHIALVRVPPCTFSLDIGEMPTDGFEPGQSPLETVVDYELSVAVLTRPIFQGMLAPVPLRDARLAGVRGVICVWTGMSDDQIANQYNPITTKYPNGTGLPVPGDPGCPALWVGDATGRQLCFAAKMGQPTVTLTLTASITKDATTDTVWGVLPGSGPDHDRGLIVNTHTDGPNVPEENGALGMLALARYFASRQRNRDLYFVMATGHFQLPQFMQWIPDRPVVGNDATSLWMTQYPNIYKKALAGVSIELLGCKMWADNANGQYVDTGKYEWGSTYTTKRLGSLNPNNILQEAYLQAVADTRKAGGINHPVVTLLPAPMFFGEGAPLYAGGLATVSLCPVPSYLLQAGSRDNPQDLNLEKLDPQLIQGQIQTFARTISTLDQVAADAF